MAPGFAKVEQAKAKWNQMVGCERPHQQDYMETNASSKLVQSVMSNESI